MTLLCIAGVEVAQDQHGRYNLNLLHKASNLGPEKAPGQWLRLESTKSYLAEIIANSYMHEQENQPVSAIRGEGTFGVRLAVIEYARWISPAFGIRVNQTFLDLVDGKLDQRLQPALPQTYADALRQLADQSEECERLESENTVMQPKAAFHDRVTVAEGAHSVAEAAQILRTGQKRLFSWLRDHRYLKADNSPYQRHLDAGLFRRIEKVYHDPVSNKDRTYVQTLVTPKGLQYLQAALDRPPMSSAKALAQPAAAS